MQLRDIKTRVEALVEQAEATFQALDRSTDGFLMMLYRSADNFGKRGTREAAALSYYALFSLFPLLLLIIVGIGWILGPSATGSGLEDFLRLFLPGPTATEVDNNITRFVQDGPSASIIALIALSWSSLGLFANLESALSRTFRAAPRTIWTRRVIGLLMVLALGVLLIANVITSLLFSFVNLIFINRDNLWVAMAGIFVPYGFSMGIFAMLYRWVPRRRVGWDAIWPAALLGGTAWEIAKRVFGWYLESISNLSLVYGSITTVIIFMLWAWYTCCIILLCAEFCVGLADWLELRRERRASRDDFAYDYYDRSLALDNQRHR